ncbi:MAG: UvrB/UvrC motif-containing protein [Planctomycetota bacterium]|jgi:protein arginine kinase activator
MQCQQCKKQTATVHLTDLGKGENRERHLCEECAAQEGIAIKQHVSINDVLNSFLMSHSAVQELGKLKCPECGTTFVEFRNQGLLGCPNDYEIFGQAIETVIERAQDGQTDHIGKSPGESADIDPVQLQRLKLQRQLRKAVEAEKYELAAELRDRLEELNEE